MSLGNGHHISSSKVPISRKRKHSASINGDLSNDELGTPSRGPDSRKRKRKDIVPSDLQKVSSSSTSAVPASGDLHYGANIKDLFHKQYPDIPQLPSPTWFSSTRNPPSLYDSLPHIHLTLQALEELSRRNRLSPKSGPIALGRDPGVEPDSLPLRRQQISAELQRFARVGGPDLTGLRGYTRPTSIRLAESETLNTESLTMSRKRGSNTQEDLEGDQKKSKRTNAYDQNFMTKLVQRNVNRIALEPTPNNFDALLEILKKPRPEMTESNFTKKHYEALRKTINREGRQGEPSVVDKVVPIIMGDTSNFDTARSILCTVWTDLVEDTELVRAQPDYFDGLESGNVYALLYDHLKNFIVPAKDAPILPNFFFEAKGPGGTKEIVERQAIYDGSFGARAMHYTRHVAKEDFSNGNAYSFSAIYASETLRLFAHFIRQPKEHGMLHYHTVALRAFTLEDSPEQVREAFTSFRNLRDHACVVRTQIGKAALRNIRSLARIKQPVAPFKRPDPEQLMHIGDDTEDETDL